MNKLSRRHFMKSSLCAGAAVMVPHGRVLGANNDIRLAVVGLGSFVKIGGKGRGDLRDFRKIPGVRIAAICDCDTEHIAPVLAECRDKGERVRAYTDVRELLDNNDTEQLRLRSVVRPRSEKAPDAKKSPLRLALGLAHWQR